MHPSIPPCTSLQPQLQPPRDRLVCKVYASDELLCTHKTETLQSAVRKLQSEAQLITTDSPAVRRMQTQITIIDSPAVRRMQTQLNTTDSPAVRTMQTQLNTTDSTAVRMMQTQLDTTDSPAVRRMQTQLTIIVSSG